MPIPIFERLASHGPGSRAVVDEGGELDYPRLQRAAEGVAGALLARRASLDGERVALWIEPGRRFPVALLGIWRAGGFAVPLALSHPTPELEHVLGDSEASAIVTEASIADRIRPLAVRLGLSVHDVDDLIGREPSATGSAMAPLPELDPDDPALLIYTSGTTGRPKGVVLRHANLAAQMASLHQAWGWSGDDHILEVLPLHHVHGLVNVVGCALWAGATCRFLPRFDAGKVWRSFVDHHPTLFMAVPTIYSRLIEAWEAAPAAERQAWSAAARRMRLMVSGSAALPVPVLERWRELTGHTLLERYGMSEIGMALSNPLLGERIAGTVGAPLPGVELRLVSAEGESVDDGEPGELEARGETVFREYWRRADATRDAFRDGWFRTGDVAVRGGAGQPAGVYRLLGRSSTDILKSGGEKISALEIEAVLRRHPQIADCAVVGLADELWGQRLAAAVELADGAADDGDSAERQPLTLERLRAWGRERLAPYKLPTRLLVVEALPRNALGKVQKPRVVERFEQEGIP